MNQPVLLLALLQAGEAKLSTLDVPIFLSMNLSAGENKIDVDGLESGIYLVEYMNYVQRLFVN